MSWIPGLIILEHKIIPNFYLVFACLFVCWFVYYFYTYYFVVMLQKDLFFCKQWLEKSNHKNLTLKNEYVKNVSIH